MNDLSSFGSYRNPALSASMRASIFYLIDSNGHSRLVLRIFVSVSHPAVSPSAPSAAVPHAQGRHTRWEGNESFVEIPTYPSHSKGLQTAQFARSESAYLPYV